MVDAPEPTDPGLTDPGPPRTPLQRGLSLARDLLITLFAAAALFHGVGWLRAPDLPEQAPDFALLDLDGKTVRLSDLRGQRVVLNFWAEWCAPCRVEVPTFRRYAKSNPDVVVLGIAVDGSAASNRAAAEALGISYPVLLADAETLSAYGVSTLPTTVTVGPMGQVRGSHAGVVLDMQLGWLARPRPEDGI